MGEENKFYDKLLGKVVNSKSKHSNIISCTGGGGCFNAIKGVSFYCYCWFLYHVKKRNDFTKGKSWLVSYTMFSIVFSVLSCFNSFLEWILFVTYFTPVSFFLLFPHWRTKHQVIEKMLNECTHRFLDSILIILPIFVKTILSIYHDKSHT